jgi:hypothetical protein
MSEHAVSCLASVLVGQFLGVLVWWEDQEAPCYLSFTSDLFLSLDLGSRVPGLYHWTVRLADARLQGQTWILRRLLSPSGERSTLFWSGPEP